MTGKPPSTRDETHNRLERTNEKADHRTSSPNTSSHASVPERRVRDFCLSLSGLSELRRALNFLSRAGHFQIRMGSVIRNQENTLNAAACRHAHSVRILSWNSAPLLPLFFHHIIPQGRASIRHFENSCALLWNPRHFEKMISLSISYAPFLLLCHVHINLNIQNS